MPHVDLRELFLMPTMRGRLSKILIEARISFDRRDGYDLIQLKRRRLGNWLSILRGDSPVEFSLIQFLKKLGDEESLCEV